MCEARWVAHVQDRDSDATQLVDRLHHHPHSDLVDDLEVEVGYVLHHSIPGLDRSTPKWWLPRER